MKRANENLTLCAKYKRAEALARRKIKSRLIRELESMYASNSGENSEIDSYNYGIHDAIEKIKEIL